ncbi:MAG TPA: aminotransferase class V-fold PLP-dependent enzyme [Edaphobacter sp.]
MVKAMDHHQAGDGGGVSLSEAEKTLDPATEREWAELRGLGHRMLDGIFDYMQGLKDTPAWREIPAETRSALGQEPVPRSGQGAEAAYESFLRDVLPYNSGNVHPRFWGWVQGGGTPLAMLSDMLASGMNPHMAGFNAAPTLVEEQVLRWMSELMGMPAGTTGLLTSGGSMANLLGLAVGRHACAGFDLREQGLRHGQPLRVYGSTETHSWLKKAMDLMGMGTAGLRVVGVDFQYRMNLSELRAAILEDRAAGYRPVCVVATAGTVNTGTTDDLEAIADLCAEEQLWFHVDGAFGALAYWSESLRPAISGMERADSLAFDLHKWGYMPFEVGAVLVRDGKKHREAFATGASYLTAMDRGPVAGGLRFAERGFELTRGFKALKVWMTLKAQGADAITQLIEQNVEQARYFASLVEASPELELAAEVPLNVVCFRYRGADDAQNQEILVRLQERGIAIPSGTTLAGRFALRVANVNHRSRREDFDVLAKAVVKIGREVMQEAAPDR